MMTDKKEVLDYLRNQQKAAEIEAKMNGVNVWVLVGAIAIVGWQLTSFPAARLWSDYELIARTIVATVAIYLLSRIIDRSDGVRDEIRYSRANFIEFESPFLVLLTGTLLFLPPLSLFMFTGNSVAVVLLGGFGFGFIAISGVAILKPLFRTSQKKDKFPKPEFALRTRTDAAITLFLGASFLGALAEQVAYLLAIWGDVSIDDAKPMMLLAVLYLLVLITLTRKRQNDSIAWTYELETELVLGAVSAEVAARKIENRRLGPRLQDVVDRFFDDLDQRLLEVDSKLTECADKISTAKQVPEQYPTERAARLCAASEEVSYRVEGLTSDCKEFREYLGRLEPKPGSGNKAVLAPVLASLRTRHDAYEKRVQTARLQLKQLLK